MIEAMQKAMIALAVLLAVAGAVDDWRYDAPAVAESYYEQTRGGGEVERKYTAAGSYEVAYAEYPSETKSVVKHGVFYPAALETSEEGRLWPIVVMANGTGVAASRYAPVLEHLASWGFVVIGNEEQNSWQGAASAESLALLTELNEDETSVFYHKLDTDNVGSAGHSQGAIGAINAVTAQENGGCYRALYTASAPSSRYAETLRWPYDVSKIAVPYFMAAGTELLDAGESDKVGPEGEPQGISPLWSQEENYGLVPASTPKIRARHANTDHADMLPLADGYMTAWFMYWLQGDQEAGEAFFGENAEILSNLNWQDVEKNI